MAYSQPHLFMSDTTTQTIASAGTPQVVTFNTTGVVDKMTVTSSSRFTVKESGVYSISANALVTCSAANKTLDMWLRKNGSDIAGSNRETFITGSGDVLLTAPQGQFSLTAGDYIEIWMNGDDTTLALRAVAAKVTPTRPATPSIILEILKIHP